MAKEQFVRTELLLGNTAMERLSNSKVAVFGIGGVGGYVAEALVRSGLGAIELIDNDIVTLSNLNRQIVALHSTLGRLKVEVMKERLLDINPEVQVTARRCFYLPETAKEFDFTTYDYIVDAVDTVTAKLELACRAKEAKIPILSSMGAGNKLNPSGFLVADIYATSVCPLAKVMRRELKKRGILELKVVYSKEPPVCCKEQKIQEEVCRELPLKHCVPGSNAFVPSAAGLLIASEVIADLCGQSFR